MNIINNRIATESSKDINAPVSMAPFRNRLKQNHGDTTIPRSFVPAKLMTIHDCVKAVVPVAIRRNGGKWSIVRMKGDDKVARGKGATPYNPSTE